MKWMNWLRRFSIRSRLITCMVLVVGIGTLVGSGMSWQLWSLKGEFDAFTRQEFTAVQKMGQLAWNLSILRGHEKAAIINAGDAQAALNELEAWQTSLKVTQDAAQALHDAAPNEEVQRQAKALQDGLNNYGQALLPTLQGVADLTLTSAPQAYIRSAMARSDADAMQESIQALNAEITALAEARRANAANGVTQAITLLWGLLLSPGFIFLPLMVLTIVSVTIPLRRAEVITQAIAHGDLTLEIDPRGSDEITHLMVSMKQMQDGLRDMVASVRESSESMLTASTQIAAGNQDLSSRTEQTASNLQSTSAAMDELSKTVESSTESSRVASGLASTASQQALNGGEVVEQVVAHMADISQASRQIGDIISVIDGIAFQTNILALNAAVEAARAGEQGRGFAVVAGEVRALAKRSAEAAREIKTLIDTSTQRVDLGSQKVRDAGAVMTEIVSSIQSVTQAMGEIAEASRQQSQGITHVGNAINELDRMTQQNAALVEESAAAADSLRQQATDLARTVQRFHIEPAKGAAIRA